MDKGKLIKGIIAVAIISTALPIVCFLSGCKTTKNATKSKVNIDSNVINQHRVIDSDKIEAELKLQEAITEWNEYLVQFDNTKEINLDSIKTALQKSGCDNGKIDSLITIIKSQENRIKRFADGSVEFTGKISRYYEQKKKDQETLLSISDKFSRYKDSIGQVITNLKKSEDKKVKEVERSGVLIPWWVWLLVVAVVALLIYLFIIKK